MVARVVICSGFIRSSITAGLPLSTARRNAGANSAVSLTTSPWPPNASMYLAKSGLVSAVPETRPGMGALLMHADRAVHLVVEHQHDRCDAVMEGRGDLLPRHHEAAIADHADDHAVGERDLGADRRRHAVAHRAVGRSDIALPVAEIQEARGPAGEVAGIGGDDRVAGPAAVSRSRIAVPRLSGPSVVRHRALRLPQRAQLRGPVRPAAASPAPARQRPWRTYSDRKRCPARCGTRGRSPPRREAPARSARCRPCRAACSPASPHRRAACRSPGSGPLPSPWRSARDRSRRRDRRQNCPACRRNAPGGGSRR